jgi:predicted ATPase/DNA-binding winged helix-turn-helix (wHTH) protein
MTLALEDCRINLDARTVVRGDERVRLTGTEVALLRYLVANPQRVLTREEIYREVWKHQHELRTRTLDLAILRLRKKIEMDPREPTHIVSVYGVGYTFVPLGKAIEASSEPEVPPAATNLGREENDFFGREEEQATLNQLVESREGCVTVLGPPGTGKTRLVKHWAAQRLASGEVESAWFCDLTESRSEFEVLQAIATSFETTLPEKDPSPAVLSIRLGRAIAARGNTLVLLDNAEQVVKWLAPLLRSIWEQAPKACFVVTSQVPLGIAMEQRMPLSPLPIATGTGAENPAVQLFVDRARLVKPSFACTEENRADIEAVVTDLDGLPLAIELAAARVHLMSPSDLRAKLVDRFRILKRPKLAGPARHMTLQAALDNSWELLHPWEQAALACCSVFRGGFDWDAVEAVVDLGAWPDAPWSVDVVATLVERSLVRVREESNTRLSLLVSVAAYAADRLAEMGDDETAGAELRHAQYYAGMRARLRGRKAQPANLWSKLMPMELENLRVVVDRAMARGWTDSMFHAAVDSFHVLEMLGAYRQASTLINTALQGPYVGVQRAELLQVLAWSLYKSGRLEASERAFIESSSLYQALGDSGGEGRNLNGLGSVYRTLGRLDEALACHKRRQELMATSENASVLWTAITHANLGNLYSDMGRLDEAFDSMAQALKMFEELGGQRQMAAALYNIGHVLWKRAEYDKTLEYYQRALAMSKQVGQRSLEGTVLGAMGHIFAVKGDLPEALACLEEAETLLRRLDDSESIATLLCHRGEYACIAGDASKARQALEEAEAIARDLGVADRSELRAELASLVKSIEALGDATGRVPETTERSRECPETE